MSARDGAQAVDCVQPERARCDTGGYEVGTRNIVDVLNAQNKLFAAQRDYANSRYDFIINSLRLKVAGTLSPEDIARLEGFCCHPRTPASGSE